MPNEKKIMVTLYQHWRIFFFSGTLELLIYANANSYCIFQQGHVSVYCVSNLAVTCSLLDIKHLD